MDTYARPFGSGVQAPARTTFAPSRETVSGHCPRRSAGVAGLHQPSNQVRRSTMEKTMGLDMYALSVRGNKPTKPVNFKLDEEGSDNVQRFHYWRKHPDLHGWMEALYYRKGGKAECFNCEPVQIDLNDLDELEAAIKAKTLPDTSGFFFGDSDGTELDDDLQFIADARAEIAKGNAVVYDSWW
jgi:hypothetical protein